MLASQDVWLSFGAAFITALLSLRMLRIAAPMGKIVESRERAAVYFNSVFLDFVAILFIIHSLKAHDVLLGILLGVMAFLLTSLLEARYVLYILKNAPSTPRP